MKDWKKTLSPILFAIAGVGFLFLGLKERVINGGPIDYLWLIMAFLYFVAALVSFVGGRWKKTFSPIPFAIVVVGFLFLGLKERVINGGPIDYLWLIVAFNLFVLGLLSFVGGRKFGGGTGPPNA